MRSSWWDKLNQPRAQQLALLLVPVLCGLLSLKLGQDDNWDLHNYHLYNPFALLHGKIGLDLAPGQWQSYFNPTLDLLYYGLATSLPGPLTGFIMGWLHGLNFVLLLGLARCLLPAGARRAQLLLALAGCLGPAFVSELGNSMGDNLTALTVLGALLLVLRQWPQLAEGCARACWRIAAAGLLAGAGCGLKLTNAPYALALCLALLALPMDWRARLKAALLFGFGVLGGIALTAGHWYWRMWQVFGNPLFPQFNDRFHAPLAAPIGVGDTGWLPQGLAEKLLWPFIFTLHPRRVSELALRHLLWPLIYVAAIAALILLLQAALRRRAAPLQLAPGSRVLLVFFGLSYLIWLNLFSIYRYLVPLELLLPLACWLLAQGLAGPLRGARLAGPVLACAALSVLSVGGWGHARWTRQAFDVSVPALAAPERSMVVTLGADPPLGWLAVFFPPQTVFASLGAGFPESDAYRARAAELLAQRAAGLYLLLPDWRADLPDAAGERVQVTLVRYGLAAELEGCRRYPARVGRNRWDYKLCPLRRISPAN